MVLSLFSTDEMIELCFSSVDELDKKTVQLANSLTQPISIRFTERDKQDVIDKIAVIQKISLRKMVQDDLNQ
jgi:hypothetical protein